MKSMRAPSLFDEPEPERSPLARTLGELAARHIYIGTSSWKYDGWLGSIYSESRYLTRGRFSRKKFEAECLAEYAGTFPAVCGDFSFYQFPSPEYWARLFHSAPASLMYAFKVPEAITVKTWPRHARYGSNAGEVNESFLDPSMFQQLFLEALAPYQAQVGPLIFEFGAFSRSCYEHGQDFFADLEHFLAALPRNWRYSVEIRNPEFLEPEYLDVLRGHNVAHVFNSWTRMPELSSQIEVPGVRTADFQVVRALLRPGRSYEHAVKTFSPYDRVQEVYDAGREALRGIIRHGLDESQATFLFVNNRFEGNAPETIAAITDL